jgi:hypothetical protein
MGGPETTLWLQVLAQAVEDTRGPQACPPKHRELIKGSTRRWIESDGREEFSFLWICDQVGLNAAATQTPA